MKKPSNLINTLIITNICGVKIIKSDKTDSELWFMYKHKLNGAQKYYLQINLNFRWNVVNGRYYITIYNDCFSFKL
jgi:hypothetical protein